MISVLFELEQVELGTLIPGTPLPEKTQKECNLNSKFTNNTSTLFTTPKKMEN